MSSIAPVGAGLQKRASTMQPNEVVLEKKRKENHYVISPILNLDLRDQTWKRLSHYVFPRARICVFETFWYPTKNRTAAKMENPQSEPDLIAYEKNAFNQSREFVDSYQYYGGVRLNSITGLGLKEVGALEQLLMPKADDEKYYELPNLERWMDNEAREGVAILADNPELQDVAEALRIELRDCFRHAQKEAKFWLAKSEHEIDLTKASGKGKASLDPLDFNLYASLGITPREDLIHRVGVTRDKEATFPQELIELLKGNRQTDILLERVEQLEKMRASAPVAEPAKVRETKLCVYCAHEIFKEAVYCVTCQKDQPITAETAPEAGAQPRVGGKFVKKTEVVPEVSNG